MSVDDGQGSINGGSIRVAAVEAGPSHPEEAGAGQHEQDVVRWEPLPVLGQARADPVSSGEASNSGG